MSTLFFQISAWNPSTILPILMVLGADVLRRSQSVPGVAPFSIGWPEFLLDLLARGRSTLPVESPCTVINARSGYARTNRSAVLEHLLRSHNTTPTRGGLTLTFLYTSQRPGIPGNDIVSYTALATVFLQLAAAGVLPILGIGSDHILTITASGTILSTAAGLLLRRQQQRELCTAREVPASRRDVVCITSGNGSAEAIVVVNEGGGVRIEDLAAGRAGQLGIAGSLGLGVLVVLWAAVLLALTALESVDAWCVLALCGAGTTYTTYAARKWRGGAALGFKFAEERKTVVRADKVMEVLMKAEELETGVGSALLPVFFPGALRPEEELWWTERKQALKATKGLKM
ncbi:uncharacterized protein TRAVEDRAFT_52983 [Trametes versicolor FP-101664 SS1]|uniref:uncharacterized protein n=1 Tax=Trametes versicolor (strain FP-101664) TaxID=717944 RepID=UPI0004621EF8|nr:uncharacterized protein TRAVEDRAFT_52983 [Trametes versicolor FP-101664 SS1]EIW52539.1 hypothetical protein TRAVEDRAFT_52983 [Trametes versicolor FP-101664 SS1]